MKTEYPDTVFHLWRRFDTKPWYRFACTIEQAHDRPAGFTVKASDPIVADTAFIARLDAHFRGPVQRKHSIRQGNGDQIDYREAIDRSSKSYFAVAARSIPFARHGRDPQR